MFTNVNTRGDLIKTGITVQRNRAAIRLNPQLEFLQGFNSCTQQLAGKIIMQEREKSDCCETYQSVLFTY